MTFIQYESKIVPKLPSDRANETLQKFNKTDSILQDIIKFPLL